MPIGYIVGNQYRLDRNYDRYAVLDVWKKLVRQLSLQQITVDVSYSFIGRKYNCELKRLTRFEKSGNWYGIPINLTSDHSPLGAMTAALRDAMIDNPEIGTPLVRVLILEAEVTLLAWAVKRALAQEAQIAAMLKQLEAALDLIEIDYDCENCIGMIEHGCFCKANGARRPGGSKGVVVLDPEADHPLMDMNIRQLARIMNADEDDDL